jgi:hypothetical protein
MMCIAFDNCPDALNFAAVPSGSMADLFISIEGIASKHRELRYDELLVYTPGLGHFVSVRLTFLLLIYEVPFLKEKAFVYEVGFRIPMPATDKSHDLYLL